MTTWRTKMKILETLFQVRSVAMTNDGSRYRWLVGLAYNGGESKLELKVDEESGAKLKERLGQDVRVTLTVPD
jgi:hypothetical protein